MFDGQVLLPEDSGDLKPNKRYLITVGEEPKAGESRPPGSYPLQSLLAHAADLGITDLAEHHDDYARR